jgi:hypothetical protein
VEVETKSLKRPIDSVILETLDQTSFVTSLLPGFNFILLYRGSRDGWKYKDFHDRCDNKGATVTVIKSSKGRISGGYTQLSWTSGGTYYKDDSAFLFSVSFSKKYPLTSGQNAIYCASNYGPLFSSIPANLALYSEPMNGDNHGHSNLG